MRTAQKKDSPLTAISVVVVSIALVVAFASMTAHQLGWLPDWVYGPGVTHIDTPQAQPTIQAVQPPRPPVAQPGAPMVAPAVVPTAYVPAVQQVQFEPAPPADVPIEDVQPRTEIVNVQRAPEQTTITRTVPNKPSGPPIVIDGGKKCRGVCR